MSVFHIQASNHKEPPPPAEPQPVPVVLRKPTHVRKASDGAKQELPPIAEDKPTPSKQKEEISSDSGDDTIKANSVKEVHIFINV